MTKALALLAGASMLAFAAPSIFDRYIAEIRQGQAETAISQQRIVDAGIEANRTRAQTPAPTYGGRVAEIDIGASGHFETTASLNGRPVHVLVDTGATYVALSERQARQLGILLAAGDFKHTARTANGENKVALATLDRVKIGSVEVRDVEVMVSKGDVLPVTLLGMSFLSKLKRFEVHADTLSLVQ
jgi:aspartyl protease family protein